MCSSCKMGHLFVVNNNRLPDCRNSTATTHHLVMRPLRQEEQQWLFTPSMLDTTPSRTDGIPLDRELEGRRETILFMRSLWLRVAAWVDTFLSVGLFVLTRNSIRGDTDAESTAAKGPLTVGATLVHRFFMRRSLKDFEPKVGLDVL